MRRANDGGRVIADRVENECGKEKPIAVLQRGVLRRGRGIVGDDLTDPIDQCEAQHL